MKLREAVSKFIYNLNKFIESLLNHPRISRIIDHLNSKHRYIRYAKNRKLKLLTYLDVDEDTIRANRELVARLKESALKMNKYLHDIGVSSYVEYDYKNNHNIDKLNKF